MEVTPARMGRRSTKTSGTNYMAFICPNCDATCGDWFVMDEFGHDDTRPTIEVKVAPSAAREPHWCLAGEDGVCPLPPSSLLEEFSTPQIADGEEAHPSVTITPVGVPGGNRSLLDPEPLTFRRASRPSQRIQAVRSRGHGRCVHAPGTVGGAASCFRCRSKNARIRVRASWAASGS